jgi:MFS family permease
VQDAGVPEDQGRCPTCGSRARSVLAQAHRHPFALACLWLAPATAFVAYLLTRHGNGSVASVLVRLGFGAVLPAVQVLVGVFFPKLGRWACPDCGHERTGIVHRRLAPAPAGRSPPARARVDVHAHFTCPVCHGAVRPTQVRTRMHRGALACYALAPAAGFLGGWLAYLLIVPPRGTDLTGFVYLAAILPICALVVAATRLPRVRVVRCPHCTAERRECLRTPGRRPWYETLIRPRRDL